ncbi:histidine kinase dimerization/phosphoacceptor domain -containing protein [Chitinophagaceae bacterium 26-R-25]|nr:histidine kinase dimerization/phosphoacceptor domain -containing protein [Chitinophagaceae bacterium 26-R-25]
MFKRALFITFVLSSCFLTIRGIAQSEYPPPNRYELSWQRLLLQLSTTYFTVARETQINLDSSLIYTSKSLGINRLTVIAEGINSEHLQREFHWIDERAPITGISQLPNVTGTKRLQLLLLLGAYYVFEPKNNSSEKDSALFFLNKAIEESKQTRTDKVERLALCLMVKLYVERGDLEQGDAIFNQLIKQCEAAKDFVTEARAWAWRGVYTIFLPTNIDERISYLQKALDLYKKQENNEQVANMLTDIGYLHVAHFQLNRAENVLRQALTVEKTLGFPATHYNYDILALVTSWKGKFGEPLKYTLEEIKIAESLRDSIGLGYFYSRLGLMYQMLGDKDDEAMIWLQKSIERFSMGKGNPSLYATIGNLAGIAAKGDEQRCRQMLAQIMDVQRRMPPESPSDHFFYHLALSVCYSSLKQYDLVEKHLIEAAKFEKQSVLLQGTARQALIDFHFGLLYYNKKEYNKALLSFERFFKAPSFLGNGLGIALTALQTTIELDSIMGNKTAQLEHYMRYTALLDSNFKVSSVRQAEELRVKYETDEKENQIILLNQNAKLEASQLKQATLIKNITIAGIVFTLIALGLLYYQFRNNQKNNKIISQKNQELKDMLAEKEWWLKEVHHRVKNNLHTIICLLESQAMYLEKDALEAIEKSQHRIYAMSLIHQKLYQNEEQRTIDLSLYLGEFIGYLKNSFDTDKIEFIINVEQVHLNLSQAIPVALIINEAVTNAIKYAFVDSDTGKIVISINERTNAVILTIADNGKGIILNDEIENKSLGIQLIKGLTKELRGTVSIDGTKGTRVIVQFKKDPVLSTEPTMQKNLAHDEA